MAELKLPRLLGAAKEFNIGQDTLIDFLIGKGFSKDDLKPTSKLTEEMYRSLQTEFQSDKAAKMKSDQVDLPKGGPAEIKKKKEEEEISFQKAEKKTVKKEEPVPINIGIEKPAEETPAVVAKAKTKKEEVPPKEEEVIKAEASFEKLKVVDKIDLSTIDSSTRPKKGAKPARPSGGKKTVEKEEKKAGKKGKKKEEPKIEEVIAKEEQPVEEEIPPVIENIEVEKLTGPKILGKIDLPIDSDTRPKKDEKRKRKRIPIEKKEVKKEELFKDKKPGLFARDDRRDRRGGGGGGRRDRDRRREEKLIDEK